MEHLIYDPTDTKEQRRAKYEAHMEAQTCGACEYERQGGQGPVIEVHSRCRQCDWAGSPVYLHICKTGWRRPVCATCNAKL